MGIHGGKSRGQAVDEPSDGQRRRKRPSHEYASGDGFLEPSLDQSPPIARHYTFSPEDFDSPRTKSYRKRLSAITANSRRHETSSSKRVTDIGFDALSHRAAGIQEPSEQERVVVSGFRQWSEGPVPAVVGNQSMDLSMCMGYDDGDTTFVGDDRDEEEEGEEGEGDEEEEEYEDGEGSLLRSRRTDAPFIDHSVDFETQPLPRIREWLEEEEDEASEGEEEEQEGRDEEVEEGSGHRERHIKRYRGPNKEHTNEGLQCRQGCEGARATETEHGNGGVEGTEAGTQGKKYVDGRSREEDSCAQAGRHHAWTPELVALVKGGGEGEGGTEGCETHRASHRLPFRDERVEGVSTSAAHATVQLNWWARQGRSSQCALRVVCASITAHAGRAAPLEPLLFARSPSPFPSSSPSPSSSVPFPSIPPPSSSPFLPSPEGNPLLPFS